LLAFFGELPEFTGQQRWGTAMRQAEGMTTNLAPGVRSLEKQVSRPLDTLAHFQPNGWKFFVRELADDPPTMPLIEANRGFVDLGNAKAQGAMPAIDDFRFPVSKQTPANAASPAFAKKPKVIEPFVAGQHHPNDLGVEGRDPREGPILLAYGKRRWRPQAAINLVHDSLNKGSNGFVLLGLWPSYENLEHGLPI
jgi:hypothetical protein